MGSSLPFSSNSNEPRNETDVTTDYEMRFARWKFDVRSSSDSPTHRIAAAAATSSLLPQPLCAPGRGVDWHTAHNSS